MIKPQEEWSGNSNLHFVFAQKLCENGDKINKGKNRPIFGKGKSKRVCSPFSDSYSKFVKKIPTSNSLPSTREHFRVGSIWLSIYQLLTKNSNFKSPLNLIHFFPINNRSTIPPPSQTS